MKNSSFAVVSDYGKETVESLPPSSCCILPFANLLSVSVSRVPSLFLLLLLIDPPLIPFCHLRRRGGGEEGACAKKPEEEEGVSCSGSILILRGGRSRSICFVRQYTLQMRGLLTQWHAYLCDASHGRRTVVKDADSNKTSRRDSAHS